MKKCLYDQWCDGTAKNLNNFTITLFKAFQYADGNNRAKIIAGWHEWFANSENI